MLFAVVVPETVNGSADGTGRDVAGSRKGGLFAAVQTI
jgi:hypothetical protein